MKNISVSIVAVVVLSSFPVMVAAQNRVLGQADIPFTFEAHGQTFERGSYERQIGTQIYAGLGNADEVMHWLTLAADEKDADVLRLRFDPQMDRYRSDPRFQAIVRRVETPE